MHRSWQLTIWLFLVLSGFHLVRAQSTPERTYKPSRIEVQILDATTKRPTPARIRITQNGRVVPLLPTEAVAVMYGLWDHEDGYAYQPDSSFYVAGKFTLNLPPGTYQLALSRGNEYLRQQQELVVRPGGAVRKTYTLQRWVNMATRNWYSTDGHIHIRRSPRENPLIMTWLQAEDVNVGALLRMGDFWETYYPQYAYGEKGNYQQGNYLLTTGQEDPRTPELGHAFAIGASNRVRQRDRYYFFDEVFDKIHQLGGLTGYAHQAETFHGYRGLILDGLRGKVDALELLQFCVDEQPLHTEHYYHMLDLGIPLTATAGSDFPWCGQDHGHGPPERTSRIGNARFYTFINGPLTYQNWRKAVQTGHTFVSSGPILDFSATTADRRKAIPGDQLDLKRTDKLTVTVHAYGHADQVPLSALEVVSHGNVIGRITPTDAGQSAAHLSLDVSLESIQRGQWIAARCYAGPGQAAHTTPIYVTVDGGSFHNPETAPRYLDLCEKYLTEIEQALTGPRPETELQAWKYRDGLQTRIVEVRRILDDLRKKYKTP
ncbi:hypothetical protein BN8_05042 [Fibrisoma limi BUZ 3]|uniref:CehA/McbA family metallohydrolase n=1 Tax=Fibrisoma limi BUZ 3 TaxID=1185876 RepID=I2GPC9_9BACT|nr:CehA/McbA family metallohydrolase [Fibrisoma limi]CCH55757.1 hypothetical protein BN8_05042 [Fibrisoma limi BUZ 3]